jgi:hypothetical protein
VSEVDAGYWEEADRYLRTVASSWYHLPSATRQGKQQDSRGLGCSSLQLQMMYLIAACSVSSTASDVILDPAAVADVGG